MLGTKDQRMANVEKNSYGERTELGHLIFTSISDHSDYSQTLSKLKTPIGLLDVLNLLVA